MSTDKHTQTLWAVNVHGPDDLIPVASYEMAIRFANAFNAWWLKRVLADHREGDPRMWAVPVVWPHFPEDHVIDETGEYAGFFEALASAGQPS